MTDLLFTIAEAVRRTFAERFKSIFALSLRVDGAVDKQRIDNKHAMAKYVTTGGDLKTVYLGFSESNERGSAGLYSAGVSWQDVFSLIKQHR